MRRALLVATTAFWLAATPSLASPTVRMEIVHYFQGCHVWSRSSVIGPSAKVTISHGTKLMIRVSCPMDFDVTQTAGPALRLGIRRLYAGTTTAIVFQRKGVYKLIAKNLKSSADAGLQTLGSDNTLSLTVRVT
jgi:hypothetical protein